MIPVWLKISGFLSYQQPVELDFEGFDLACISGSNGAGKSSLLDAITWALFGQARRRDDAIVNSHCEGAEVVFDFRYEGSLYRVQRSKVKNKTTLLDFFIKDSNESWRTLSEHALRETETRIEQTLRMDYETFTNASFFLQGKADQFAQQKPGDRKRILSSILDLEVWETYRESAVQRRKKLELDLAGLNSRLEEIEAELQQEEERKAALKQLQADMEQVAVLRKAREETLDQQRKLAASLAEQERLVKVLQTQIENAKRRCVERRQVLAARKQERELYLHQIETAGEIDSAFEAWQAMRQELETWDKIAADFRQLENQRTAPLTTIEAERSRIRQEIKSLSDMQQKIHPLQEDLPALRKQQAQNLAALSQTAQSLSRREELESEFKELQERSAEAAAENKRLKTEMTELKQRIDQLNETSGAACPLCGQPLNDEDRLHLVEELENSGKQLGDRYRKNQEETQKAEERYRAIEADLNEMKKLEPVLRQQQRLADQLEDQVSQAEDQVQNWQENLQPHLSALQKILEENHFAPEARSRLAEIDAQLEVMEYNPAKHEALKQAEQKMRTSEDQKRQLERARATLEPLEREIGETEKGLAGDESEILRQEKEYQAVTEKYKQEAANLPDIRHAEEELFNLQEQENRIRLEVGGAIQKVEILKTLAKRKTDLKKQRESCTRRITQLKSLERAFGKDGVPALLIEQALPEIEAQANEILDRLTAGGMSVRFETQQDYKDKKRDDKKETLEILISDAAGMREYAMFSGGEAFRVNFAIRLALSRVLAQRAGARLQTLVIDEGFGSQDSEGRQRLIEAINMVRPDFEKVLVITHLEELKDAFPARIEVLKTERGSQVRVVV